MAAVLFRAVAALPPLVIGFLVTFFSLRWWISKAREFGFVGRDMNKPGDVKVHEAGGVWVAVGLAFGLLFYVAFRTYVTHRFSGLLEILAVVSVALLAAFLGFLDDILGWKKGLRAWQKVFFSFPLALPLIVVKAGETRIAIPLFGVVDLGILYPLLVVPVGVVGAANGFNMLAGYNGLEAGMALVLLSAVLIKSLGTSKLWIGYMALIGIVTVSAFLLYNWYPAKVFPGDSFTHFFGSFYAALLILGNMEKFGIIIFAPYFLDALLYLRAKFVDRVNYRVEAFAKVLPDGSLDMPYEKIYDTTHLAIAVLKRLKGKVYEKDVTLFCLGIEVAVVILSLVFL